MYSSRAFSNVVRNCALMSVGTWWHPLGHVKSTSGVAARGDMPGHIARLSDSTSHVCAWRDGAPITSSRNIKGQSDSCPAGCRRHILRDPCTRSTLPVPRTTINYLIGVAHLRSSASVFPYPRSCARIREYRLSSIDSTSAHCLMNETRRLRYWRQCRGRATRSLRRRIRGSCGSTESHNEGLVSSRRLRKLLRVYWRPILQMKKPHRIAG